jgi:hypothetical protein
MNLSNSTLVDCVTQPTLRCAEDSSTFQEVAADLVSKVFDIPIFFSPSMVADANSFSPSPSKPLSAIQSWAGLGINLHEIPSTPATPEQFYLAHDKTFELHAPKWIWTNIARSFSIPAIHHWGDAVRSEACTHQWFSRGGPSLWIPSRWLGSLWGVLHVQRFDGHCPSAQNRRDYTAHRNIGF